MLAARQTSLRNSKAAADRVRLEITARTSGVPEQKEEGYPIEMVNYMSGQVGQVQEKVDVAADVMGKEVITARGRECLLEDIEADIKTLDDATTALRGLTLDF